MSAAAGLNQGPNNFEAPPQGEVGQACLTSVPPAGSHEPFFNPEVYPEFLFRVDLDKIVQSETLVQVTANSRLRYGLGLLKEACGDHFDDCTNPAYRTGQLETEKKWLSATVTRNLVKLPRRELIDADRATVTTLVELADDKHPVPQMLTAIEKAAQDQEVELPSKMLLEFSRRLLVVTEWETLRYNYEAQLHAK